MNFEKVTLTAPLNVADIKPLPEPSSPELTAFIERRHRQLFMDVQMQVYDPMFYEYCRRMAQISGRSHLDVAEAGYGLSDEPLLFKKA